MSDVIEIPKGYQKTKVGVIPETWQVVKLGDLGNTLTGLTYSPDDIAQDGILVLRSSNIQDGRLHFEDNVYVRVTDLKYNSVKEDDILICVRNGSKSLIGKNALITKKEAGMAFGAFMSIFRSSSNHYTYQLFNSDYFKSQIHKNLGATINSINGSDLKKFKFPFPTNPEREKMAAILNTWDKAIEHVQDIIDNLSLRNKGLAQQLLTGKTRLKGFDGGWKNLRILDIADQQNIYNKEDLGLEVLSCTKYDGLVRSLDYFGRQVFGNDLSKYKIVPNGSFAYATNHIEEGSIGYQNVLDHGLISPMYTVFKTKSGINDDFLFRLLKTDRLIYAYQSNMAGSINRRGGLRWKDFSTIHIKLPGLEEQTAINDMLIKADEELHISEKKLSTLQKQKKGLMEKLLTGEMRVNV